MRENIIIKIFRFFIPLRETKSDNREKEDTITCIFMNTQVKI